jgi:hypothetical protein
VVTALNPGDLTETERVLLALLGAGLAPSSLAHDASFRLDYLSAVTLALVRGQPENAYLTPAGEAIPEVQRELSEAIYDLTDKRVLSAGGPSADPLVNLEGQQAPVADRSTPINFDQHPTVFDRYLAGRCLDELLRNTDVYHFVMAKYADSSEIWQRVARQSL